MGRKTCIGFRFLFHRQLWSVAMMAESTATGCTAKKCSCEWHSDHTFQRGSVFADYTVWCIFYGVGQCLADSAHQLAWLCHKVVHRHTPMQYAYAETYWLMGFVLLSPNNHVNVYPKGLTIHCQSKLTQDVTFFVILRSYTVCWLEIF